MKQANWLLCARMYTIEMHQAWRGCDLFKATIHFKASLRWMRQSMLPCSHNADAMTIKAAVHCTVCTYGLNLTCEPAERVTLCMQRWMHDTAPSADYLWFKYGLAWWSRDKILRIFLIGWKNALIRQKLTYLTFTQQIRAEPVDSRLNIL